MLYDYHEGSVKELALRAHLLRGYEQFKASSSWPIEECIVADVYMAQLIHGTFDSILSFLGQQALELQLERFFTVWAWTWEMEDELDFSSFLGASLQTECQPQFNTVKQVCHYIPFIVI